MTIQSFHQTPGHHRWERYFSVNTLHRHNKRAARYGSQERLHQADLFPFYQLYPPVCLACGDANRDCLTLDHVIPLSLGGRNHPGNLQILCQRCNEEKADQVIDYRARASWERGRCDAENQPK